MVPITSILDYYENVWKDTKRQYFLKEENMDAMMARCHSERGCKEQLEDSGWCKSCGTFASEQVVCLIPYCPDCKCPLDDLACPRCSKVFQMPRN